MSTKDISYYSAITRLWVNYLSYKQQQIRPIMCINVPKDTAKRSGHTKCRQSNNGSEDDKTTEQDFKLFAWQTRPDVVDERMNLAQAKHAQRLRKEKQNEPITRLSFTDYSFLLIHVLANYSIIIY